MSIEPVRQEITVAAPVAHAFSVFTDQFDVWWPRSHHIGKDENFRGILESRPGGRWFERNQDGTECDWGKVLEFEPPHRLLLSWQLDADWAFDPGLVTEVEVTFTELSPTSTLVRLEHRNLERFGERAAEVRRGIAGERGWPAILATLRELVLTGSR